MTADEPGARQRILDTAGTLFAERGFDRVSVAEIASTAGVSTGLIYYHFEDKRCLFEGIVRESIDRLDAAAIRTLAGEGTPTDRLCDFIVEYMALLEGQSASMRLALRNITDARDPVPQAVVMRGVATIDRVESVVIEGVDSGEFKSLDPHLAAIALFALVNTLMTARALDTPIDCSGLTTREQAQFMCDLFFDGVRAPRGEA